MLDWFWKWNEITTMHTLVWEKETKITVIDDCYPKLDTGSETNRLRQLSSTSFEIVQKVCSILQL